MRVTFWGTRGSIATPGSGTLRYGGNTSCVELRSSEGELIVFDCGTGARSLGQAVMAEAHAEGRPTRGSILLGHTHWDHIQGMPFFEPLFDGAGHWEIYGPRGLGTSLAQTLAGQMQYQYFPVAPEQFAAAVSYRDLVEGSFELGDVLVRTQYLNHPALTLGYRIEAGDAVFCYLSDHEPFDPELGAGGDVLASREDRRHVEFMAGADVVIHDAQYDASEYPSRRGWGHSTMEYVVDAACAAGVGRIVLYHHDPSRTDDEVDALVTRARDRAAGRVDVLAAAEGASLEVRAHGSSTSAYTSRHAAGAPAVHEFASAVVVAVADQDLRARISGAAAAEHLDVVDALTGAPDVDAAERAVVIVDVDDRDCRNALDRLQQHPSGQSLAVIGVTRSSPGRFWGTPGVTEWLVWPASAAHIRTKLHASVIRSACRWMIAPRPPDEEHRLAALHDLKVLDTPAEERFDRYTDALCESLSVPIALITLIDAERQWFKSRRGIEIEQTTRDEAVCAHTILGSDVLQVPDLLEDARFADNPAVTGPGRARFYAGAPLVLQDGSRVGSLCVVDHRPRMLDDDELSLLRRLAREVADELQRPADAG